MRRFSIKKYHVMQVLLPCIGLLSCMALFNSLFIDQADSNIVLQRRTIRRKIRAGKPDGKSTKLKDEQTSYTLPGSLEFFWTKRSGSQRNKDYSPGSQTTHASGLSATKSTSKPPDDTYWPVFNFSVVKPEIQPTGINKSEYFLLVVVNSGADARYYPRRHAIRRTWGSPSHDSSERKWCVVFTLGKTQNKTLNELVIKEANTYNDILIGDFEDIYFNLLIKTFMSHVWAAEQRCSYILKTDDDVYVKVPSLIAWLVRTRRRTRFYGGHVYTGYIVGRVKGHKWSISKRYYEQHIFPPFCAGAFHVVSADVVALMVNHTKVRRPFHMDDAYLGVAASDLGIKAVRISGFNAYVGNTDICESSDLDLLLSEVAIGHGITPACMDRIHRLTHTSDSTSRK